MTHAHTFTHPQAQASLSSAITKLVRDNVLRVGLVAFGMTLFIAAAEAKTPINEVNLGDLPSLVTQVANQSAAQGAGRIGSPYIARQYLASDDFAADIGPSHLLNSPAARFLAQRLN